MKQDKGFRKLKKFDDGTSVKGSSDTQGVVKTHRNKEFWEEELKKYRFLKKWY